jgi:molybdenum cofactor biosynthesis enzyme MoaA
VSIDCATCDKLLLAYKRAIKLYLDAEQNIAERHIKQDLGKDYTAALEEAERLKLAYRDASDAFMEHWQQDHHVSPMAASASSNR